MSVPDFFISITNTSSNQCHLVSFFVVMTQNEALQLNNM